MNPSLDSLTDAQLSEAVAVEVAGFTRTIVFGNEVRWHYQNGDPCHEAFDYATSADAVLPLLEKWRGYAMDIRIFSDGWGVSIRPKNSPTAAWVAKRAPTFPRAACLALLLAARAKGETTSASSASKSR